MKSGRRPPWIGGGGAALPVAGLVDCGGLACGLQTAQRTKHQSSLGVRAATEQPWPSPSCNRLPAAPQPAEAAASPPKLFVCAYAREERARAPSGTGQPAVLTLHTGGLPTLTSVSTARFDPHSRGIEGRKDWNQ